jgi:hypothetical protein
VTNTLHPPLRPSCHIEALLALDPDASSPKVVPDFTPALATPLPDVDRPPDQWD